MSDYQVVISFRVTKQSTVNAIVAYTLSSSVDIVGDVDVAVREIGAGGETVEMEGEGP